MKFYKKLLGFIMAMMMVFAVSACSSGEASDEKAQTPEEVMKAAEAKMREVNNMESEMFMDVTMKAAEQSVTMKTNIEIVAFTDPMKMKLIETVDLGELAAAPQTLNAYIEEVDGNKTMYIDVNGTWYKQAVQPIQMTQFDTISNLVEYLNVCTQFTESGTEQINGEDATKYDAVISKDNLRETLESAWSQAGLGEGSELSEMDFSDVDDVKASIWINAEGYPVKYDMDMADVMNKVMAKFADPSQTAPSIENLKITITAKNFNVAEEFEIPEATKDAIEM